MATITKSPIDTDVEIVHSTYRDNPFLPPDYVQSLEKIIDEDENYYRIYALGEWGLLQRRIYTNYRVIPELPYMENAKWAYGLDYGLVNESALVKVWVYRDKFYAEEKLYRTGMTVADIIEFLSHQDRADIYADPSAKMMTAEVRQAGFMAFDGIKGVKESIDLCQRQTIYIPETSQHLVKEIRSYQWKKDKQGNILPEPVKFNDHAVDAMRYAIWGLASRYGFATARPNTGGPIDALSFYKDKAKNDNILKRWMKKL